MNPISNLAHDPSFVSMFIHNPRCGDVRSSFYPLVATPVLVCLPRCGTPPASVFFLRYRVFAIHNSGARLTHSRAGLFCDHNQVPSQGWKCSSIVVNLSQYQTTYPAYAGLLVCFRIRYRIACRISFHSFRLTRK